MFVTQLLDGHSVRQLMIVRFGNTEVYHAWRYDGQNDPSGHLMECKTLWAS